MRYRLFFSSLFLLAFMLPVLAGNIDAPVDPCRTAGGCDPRTGGISEVQEMIARKERQIEACKGRLKCSSATLQKHQKKLNHLETELQMKFSLPSAPFFITLLVAPLGILLSKHGNYVAASLSIALVFVWYTLYSGFLPLGYAGKVSPFLAAWIQNIVFGGLGILFLLKLIGLPQVKLKKSD